MLGTIVFGVLAIVVVGSALGMIGTRNTVYAALFLVLNFSTVALLYLILAAPFISLVQVTVYAGAIMVLFLFVIMMLGVERVSESEPFPGQRFLAAILAMVFLGESLLVLVVWRGTDVPPLALLGSDFASPAVIGELMFTQYALPFLIAAMILLAAVIGAIALPRGDQVKHIIQAKKEE